MFILENQNAYYYNPLCEGIIYGFAIYGFVCFIEDITSFFDKMKKDKIEQKNQKEKIETIIINDTSSDYTSSEETDSIIIIPEESEKDESEKNESEEYEESYQTQSEESESDQTDLNYEPLLDRKYFLRKRRRTTSD
jgi:hypothetical protein